MIWFQLENVGGASQFPALWHFAEGLFYFYKLFFRKRRIFENCVVYTIIENINISILYTTNIKRFTTT